MSSPREAQLPLLLAISEGLSRGTNEMLRVSPQGDAIHPPSCSLAIRESVEEIKWLRAEVEKLTRERDEARSKETDYREGFQEGWDAAHEGTAAVVKKLRAKIERLRTVYVLLASEEVGPVDSATCWYEDKIIGCYISREAAEGAAKLLMADWRINEYALEAKP